MATLAAVAVVSAAAAEQEAPAENSMPTATEIAPPAAASPAEIPQAPPSPSAATEEHEIPEAEAEAPISALAAAEEHEVPVTEVPASAPAAAEDDPPGVEEADAAPHVPVHTPRLLAWLEEMENDPLEYVQCTSFEFLLCTWDARRPKHATKDNSTSRMDEKTSKLLRATPSATLYTVRRADDAPSTAHAQLLSRSPAPRVAGAP